VTGKNGNSIFLPAAGYRDGTSLCDAGSYGYYWSSTAYEDYSNYAYYLHFNSDNSDWSYYEYRYIGQPIRPVTE